MTPNTSPVWGSGDQSAAREGVLSFGAPISEAQAAVILVHGRGASAISMQPLAEAWARPGVAFLAPDAAKQGGAWYPHSFQAPLEDNEPQLSRALETLDALVKKVTAGLASPSRAGIESAPGGTQSERFSARKLLLVGFSQGACLAVEYAARHARRYGGLAVLSGSLIGPPETPRDYPGSLNGTPVFLGCSDNDPHIPRPRFEETDRVLTGMGAQVTARLYPDLPHTINDDEIATVDSMIAALLGSSPA